MSVFSEFTQASTSFVALMLPVLMPTICRAFNLAASVRDPSASGSAGASIAARRAMNHCPAMISLEFLELAALRQPWKSLTGIDHLDVFAFRFRASALRCLVGCLYPPQKKMGEFRASARREESRDIFESMNSLLLSPGPTFNEVVDRIRKSSGCVLVRPKLKRWVDEWRLAFLLFANRFSGLLAQR